MGEKIECCLEVLMCEDGATLVLVTLFIDKSPNSNFQYIHQKHITENK